MIPIGSLVAELGLETKGFEQASKMALGILGAITAAATAAVVAVVKITEATFEWANELDSIQDVTGATVKQAAALNFVLRKSGTDTDTLTKGMVVLEKSLFKVDGSLDKAGEKLAEYGINARDANGEIKDQAQLISEISDKYNSLGTQTERVNLLTELFGKSGANLIDVFDTLAKEGGMDKVTDKVEKMGLAIDPQKYEDFQRNLEEIKLAFLGVAMTIVDNLMPQLRGFIDWWESDGLPAFQGMVKWLNWYIPQAIDVTKAGFEELTNYNQQHVMPNVRELTRLYENVDRILKFFNTDMKEMAINTLMSLPPVQMAISIYVALTQALDWLAKALDLVNDILEAGIGKWMRYTGAAASAANVSVPSSGATIPSSTGSTGGRSGNRGRATGGAVMAGQTYRVQELGRAEYFTPNQAGRISNGINVTARLTDNDLDRLAKTVSRAIAPQLQKVFA